MVILVDGASEYLFKLNVFEALLRAVANFPSKRGIVLPVSTSIGLILSSLVGTAQNRQAAAALQQLIELNAPSILIATLFRQPKDIGAQGIWYCIGSMLVTYLDLEKTTEDLQALSTLPRMMVQAQVFQAMRCSLRQSNSEEMLRYCSRVGIALLPKIYGIFLPHLHTISRTSIFNL